MKTFFFLTDLPEQFTRDFSIEQIVRYGNIIDNVKKCAQLEIDHEELDIIGGGQLDSQNGDFL